MMNKKNCCGCFGCGCFVVIAAFLIGGYMGVDFLHGKGVEFAASGLIHTVDKLTEMAFADADREEINKAAVEVAEKIRSGEIGLMEVMTETGQKLENNLHNQAMLLAFYRQNYELAEKPVGEGAEAAETTIPAEAAEPAELVDRLIFGMMNKKVSKDQTASLTAVLVERYTETVESKDGSGRITTSSRRLKKTLTPEDRAASLDMMRKICNENNLPVPGADFDRTAAVKQELLNFFADLKKAGKKE
ncbi:MAG: hypothetical protein GQF41_3754 [Candidatus Rifleibacterium amylolyticum]|nr:MAG: hypothetical protein GQF41_3754 [Candidatus Rifleibacterium amylolyticum]